MGIWNLPNRVTFGRLFLAAALFAVHPVHVEAVANIVGRKELLTSVFVLAGLVWRIVVVSWNGYANHALMVTVRTNSFVLHFATCVVIGISSLVAAFSR